MSTAKTNPSISELIEEIQEIACKNPKAKMTRDFYRGKTQYRESDWTRHFATFASFLEAASLEEDEPELSESNEIVGDTWNVTLPKTRISTLPELLDHCKVDTAVWEVERFVVNKWEMGYVNKRTEQAEALPLFQVKATLKKRTQIIAIREEIESMKAEAKLHAPIPPLVVRSVRHTGNMLEIAIPDLHMGKLAWDKETGWESYDTKLAEKVFVRALETILDRVSHFNFDKVVFVVGNDLLNSDNAAGTTTKGTAVSTDGRYQKTFTITRKMVIDAIQRLRQLAPVTVVMVSGNHDDLSVWHLGDSLECYFHNYRDVEIDNSPTYRKYLQHGHCLLMWTHGDKGKRQDFPLLMATEKPMMFGTTKFRECHTGHLHTTKTEEQHGVRVRVLPALCPPDAWHAENAFVGNQRNAEGYVWHEAEGLITQVFHNDDAYTTDNAL